MPPLIDVLHKSDSESDGEEEVEIGSDELMSDDLAVLEAGIAYSGLSRSSSSAASSSELDSSDESASNVSKSREGDCECGESEGCSQCAEVPSTELDESDAEEVTEVNGSQEENSSDEAPDSISFETGKISVLKAAENAIKQITKDKLDVKQKRKAQDDLYKKQKKEKVDRLRESRLPEELLEDVATSTSTSFVESSQRNSSGNDADVDDDSDEYQSDSEVKAVTMSDVEKINGQTVQSLKDIKEQRLNGNFNRRQSNKTRMAKIEKRKAASKK